MTTFEVENSEIGALQSGWTVQADATPSSVADSSGSTGGLDLSVEPARFNTSSLHDEPEFLLGRTGTFEAEVGSVVGFVDSATISGAPPITETTYGITEGETGISLSVSTALTPLNIEVTSGSVPDIPGPISRFESPSLSGSETRVAGAVDGTLYTFTLSGSDWTIKVYNRGVYVGPITWSPVAAGFTTSIYAAVGGTNDRIYLAGRATTGSVPKIIVIDATNGALINSWGAAGSGDGQFNTSQWGTFGSGSLAIDTSGGRLYVTDYRRVQWFTLAGSFTGKATANNSLYYVTAIGLSSAHFYISTRGGSATDSLYLEKFTRAGSYVSQVALSPATHGTGLVMGHGVFVTPSEETVVVFTDGEDSALPANDRYISTVTSVYAAAMSVRSVISNRNRYYDYSHVASDGSLYYARTYDQVVDVGAEHDHITVFSPGELDLYGAYTYYFGLGGVYGLQYTATENPSVVYKNWQGNLWANLKALAAANFQEIVPYQNAPLVRDLGSVEFGDVEPVAGTVSVEMNYDQISRSIIVNQYQTSRTSSGAVYDATDDGNRLFTVGVGETVTQTVTGAYPLYMAQPVKTESLTPAIGEYYVIGEDNLPVTNDQWEAYRGSVTVAASQSVAGGIDITFRGPNRSVAGNVTFTFGISDGETTHAAFSILGEGVFSEAISHTIPTGASALKTRGADAVTVDSPFITSKGQAYDRGAWAASFFSGAQATMNLTVLTSSISGLGLTEGSVFQLRNSRWRVVSTSVGDLTTAITALQHTTTADIDALWATNDTSDWDDMWAYEPSPTTWVTSDQFALKPLAYND